MSMYASEVGTRYGDTTLAIASTCTHIFPCRCTFSHPCTRHCEEHAPLTPTSHTHLSHAPLTPLTLIDVCTGARSQIFPGVAIVKRRTSALCVARVSARVMASVRTRVQDMNKKPNPDSLFCPYPSPITFALPQDSGSANTTTIARW